MRACVVLSGRLAFELFIRKRGRGKEEEGCVHVRRVWRLFSECSFVQTEKDAYLSFADFHLSQTGRNDKVESA